MRFFRKLLQLFSQYDPAIKVFVSRARLLHNLKEYRKAYPSLSFAPVLKSNAYGHGLVEVAQILDNQGTLFFVLDSLYEAKLLRQNGVRTPIQIIGFVAPKNIAAVRLKGIAFTIVGLEQLRELTSLLSREIDIHIKIDTGMHRQGITIDQIDEVIHIVKNNPHLNLVGICSHFADADGESLEFTHSQIEVWREVVALFKKEFHELPYIHIAATAGADLDGGSIGTIARLGLGLYGINPSPRTTLNLLPALRTESVVASLRTIQKGESVGYNATYTAERETMIATIPAGYFEGVDRRLSNRGVMKIGNALCPIVGRVSMNITSIDVTHVSRVGYGDRVIVISDDARDQNSIQGIASLAHTIPWETLVHIPQHLRRVIE